MSAVASLTLYDAMMLVRMADVAASLTLEALNGIIDAFDERIHSVRGHRGQIVSAGNIRDLVAEVHLLLGKARKGAGCLCPEMYIKYTGLP